MKNLTMLVIVFGLIAFFVLPTNTRAEIAFGESIEWILAGSDRVVIGKVTKVDMAIDQDKKECHVLTVAVSKTFKGEKTEQITFVMPPYLSHSYAKQWLEEGFPIIFCLVKNDEKRVTVSAKKYAWMIRQDGNGPDAILLGKSKHHWSGSRNVLTRDFEVLTDFDVIQKYIEKLLKDSAKDEKPRFHRVEVPFDTAVDKKLRSMSTVFLKVPIDEKLEELGRKWCKSESPHERIEGAIILRYFKNDKNVELLKSLLDDPSTSESTSHTSEGGNGEMRLIYRKKIYYVRQAAYDALCKLSITIDKPVLEVLLEGKDDEKKYSELRKFDERFRTEE